jgi:putative ABC transport system permease protein
VLPALDGAIVGVPVGMALAEALDDDPVTIPALWPLLAVVLGGVLVIAALTAIPAHLSARRGVAETLRSELA